MEKIGLDLVQDYYLHLLTLVVQRASPFLTQNTMHEVVIGAMAKGVSQEKDVSSGARARILQTSRSTYYRSRRKGDPDQYSILQQIVDCLCPIYPEGLTALDILHRVAARCPDLSLSELVNVLKFYTRRGCFEQDGDVYRLPGSLVWVNEDLSKRLERLTQFAAAVTDGMEGFLREQPYNHFRVVRIFGTEEEFNDFMEGLRLFIDDWCARNPAPPTKGDPDFIVAFVSTEAKKETTTAPAVPGEQANGT